MGGAVAHCFLDDEEPADIPLPPVIENIHTGGMKRMCLLSRVQDIYPLFAGCDTVVMASPLYFWTITSRLKAFIERLYAISVNDKYPSKDTVLFMTAGDDQDTTFEQPLRYFRLISQVLGGNKKGVYCAGGCIGCEKAAREIDGRHLENAYRMGLEL